MIFAPSLRGTGVSFEKILEILSSLKLLILSTLVPDRLKAVRSSVTSSSYLPFVLRE